MEKICLSCQLVKPTSAFYTDRSRKDSLGVYCKDCTKAKVKDYAHRAPRIQTPEGTRHCQICKETKPLGDFYKHDGVVDGYGKRCKECSKKHVTAWRKKNPEKHRASAKRWSDKNPELKKDVNLKVRIGLPIGTYATMLAAQNGLCAICRTSEPGGKNGRFHVDHCHETKEVRGLLCTNCNTGIGHMKHRVTFLQAAIEYLQITRK